VRIAVQGGPLSAFFDGISYDPADNSFHPAEGNDRQLIPVFQAIFGEAVTASHDTAWLAQWKPMLDVVIGDYVRGDAYLLNTYGFLASNIVAAYEDSGLALGFADVASALGIPPELIVTGSGTLAGSDDADVFYVGATNDILRGGAGPDTYVFGHAIGHDVIDDVELALVETHVPDMIRFAHLTPGEISAARNGLDLILTVTATGETITVLGQFEGELPTLFGSDMSDDTGVGEIVFADGTVWDLAAIAEAVRDPRPTSDALTGTPSVDFLDSGAGDDTMTGGEAGDLYYFGLGYGHDTVQDSQTNVLIEGPDVIMFGPGITRDDVTLQRDGNSLDLQIGIAGSDDTLTVSDQFGAFYTGPFGVRWFDRVEAFVFEDKSYVTWQEVMETLVSEAKTADDDTIYGFSYEDVLDGGAGNDLLSGGNENDIYVFGTGYGADHILEGADNISGGMVDTLQFTSEVLPADVSFARDGATNDLLITLSSGDTLRIEGQFDAFSTGAFGTLWFNRAERFEFSATDEVLTYEDIMARILVEAKTEGDDAIYGYFREDVLDGGAGNDTLAGGNEGDTYVWGRGYDNDTVYDLADGVAEGADIDRISFAEGVLPSEIVLSRPNGGDDLVLTIADTGETLTIQYQFLKFAQGLIYTEIEEFSFANGTVWTPGDIRTMLIATEKTAGNDIVYGFHTADVLDGGAGDDTLVGNGGGDTFVFDAGYGHDTVDADIVYVTRDAPDTVQFGAGITPGALTLSRVNDDLIIDVAGSGDRLTISAQFSSAAYSRVESFTFAGGTIWTWQDVQVQLLASTAGSDTLIGYATDDTLDGGAGNDLLKGRGGNDTYVFGLGYGRDTVDDDNASVIGDAPDRVLFKAGVSLSDLEFVRVGTDDLVIRINGTDDELAVKGQFVATSQISNFEFASGTVLTSGDVADIIAQNGPGHVTHRGTAAAETIVGTSSDDIIDGRGGNDTLQGGWGSDTYLFGSGSANDTVAEDGLGSDTDTLKLGGLNAADVTLGRSGLDLTVTINAGGETVTVAGHFDGTNSGIEQLLFADGTSLDRAAIEAAAWYRGTAGNDTITGNGADNTLDGLGGDDLLKGSFGSDTYLYRAGDGNDTIQDEGLGGDTDKLKLVALNAADITLGRTGLDLYVTVNATNEVVRVVNHFDSTPYGLEQIVFADGSSVDRATIAAQAWFRGTSAAETINGTGAADTFDGLGGDDLLKGGFGSDTYVYRAGSGNDSIQDEGLSGDTDKLKLIGLNSGDVTLGRTGLDLYVTISATGEVARVINHFDSPGYGMEQLVFADATTWDRTTIAAQAWLRGTAAAETINGTGAADTFDGLGGDDLLKGGFGSDTYIYRVGSGNDTIQDEGLGGDTDKIKLIGLNVADVTLSRVGADLFIMINSSGETLKGLNHFDGTGYGMEQLIFADGTTWDRATIQAEAALRGTSGNDTINGTGGNDTLDGLGGNDLLKGGQGSDTYLYRVGSGYDTIQEDGFGWDVDKLKLIGLNATDVELWRAGLDLYVNVVSTGETLKVQAHFDWGPSGLEQIIFANSTIPDRASIAAAARTVVFGTSGNDTLNGTSSDDMLIGGAGADTLNGSSGSDTASYATAAAGVTASLTTPAQNGGDAAGDSYSSVENLTGSAFNDTLAGDGNANRIEGRAGSDMLTGNAGNDIFVFGTGFGQDTITDFASGAGAGDVMEFFGLFADFAAVQAASAQVGSDVQITLDAATRILLQNVTLANLNQDDFLFH
jgi:Ca2+-binding RTX toxin-like protein